MNKTESKNKRRVLQTLRGHSLSTQDQGQCQRPDVMHFVFFFLVVSVFFFWERRLRGVSKLYREIVKDCRRSENLQ